MSNEISKMASAISAQNSGNKQSGSWFEAMAEAWGKSLDSQAERIQSLSDGLDEGIDTPSQVTALSAESLRMGFLSNSAHTSLNGVGTALETLARKQ